MKLNFRPLLYAMLGGAAVFAMALSVEQLSVDPVTRACSQIVNFQRQVLFYGADLQTTLSSKVSTSTTVNGHPLSGNVSVTQADVGLSNVSNVAPGTGASQLVQRNASAYFPLINSMPSTTAGAGVNFPSGVAPSAPNVGDFWYDGTHLYFNTGTLHDLLAGGGSGSTSNTSYNGSNWTNTTTSPSQRAVAEQIPATPISALSSANQGQPVSAVYVSTADSNTELMLHFDSSIADASLYGHSMSNFGTTTDSTHYKFGGAAQAFDGSSMITTPYSAALCDLGSGDFTIEGWVYYTLPGVGYAGLVSAGGTSGWALYMPADSSGHLGFNAAAGGWGAKLTGTTAMGQNTWHHIAVVRHSGTLTEYVDGVAGATASYSGNVTGNSSQLEIGQDGNGNYYKGTIDELRISNNARYTSNFTPQTSEFFPPSAKYDISASTTAQNLGSRSASAPSILAGTGAGTSPTIAVAGSDASFQITLTTGSAPTGSNATIATVTYAGSMPNTAYCICTPANANAAALSGATQVFATTSTSALTLTSGASALAGTTTYVWNIHSF